jgi:REP element-mobilizing transposase RayT
VTAHGNERRRTFRDDADRQQFMAMLEQVVQEHGLRVHGYCLMPNHYHLLVETPRANLSRSIGWLQTTYTIRFNRRHRRSGHLFQGRFKAHLVEVDSYAMELLRYVHLNPVRPRDRQVPVPRERSVALRQYPWSSHRAYLGKSPAPSWLCTDWLSFFGRRRSAGQKEYDRFVKDAFESAVEDPWARLQGGLVLGSEAFVERVRDWVGKKSGREEVRWVSQEENPQQRRVAAQALAVRQKKRCWAVWVRVVLGGERRSDVARSYGYRGVSAITQILKRLPDSDIGNKAVAARMNALATELKKALSTVES